MPANIPPIHTTTKQVQTVGMSNQDAMLMKFRFELGYYECCGKYHNDGLVCDKLSVRVAHNKKDNSSGELPIIERRQILNRQHITPTIRARCNSSKRELPLTGLKNELGLKAHIERFVLVDINV